MIVFLFLDKHNICDENMFAAPKNLDMIKKPIAVVYTLEETLQYQLSEEDYLSPTDEIYQIEVDLIVQYGDNREIDQDKRTLAL